MSKWEGCIVYSCFHVLLGRTFVFSLHTLKPKNTKKLKT